MGVPRQQPDQSHAHAGIGAMIFGTDQVLFTHGLMPRDWLPPSELAECAEARTWKAIVSASALTAICWSAPTDREGAVALPKA